MKALAVLGAVGYLYLIVEFGWVGIAAAALHVGAMLMCIKR